MSQYPPQLEVATPLAQLPMWRMVQMLALWSSKSWGRETQINYKNSSVIHWSCLSSGCYGNTSTIHHSRYISKSSYGMTRVRNPTKTVFKGSRISTTLQAGKVPRPPAQFSLLTDKMSHAENPEVNFLSISKCQKRNLSLLLSGVRSWELCTY